MKVYKPSGDSGVPIKLWINDFNEIEPPAMLQLMNMSKLPFIFRHIAVMPDVHLGIGATVGSVVPTVTAVVPAAVGVDIGCGMNAVKTSTKAPIASDILSEYRRRIEQVIPVGNGPGGSHVYVPDEVTSVAGPLWVDYERMVMAKHEIVADKLSQQLGTLGGGNHFIELCVDQYANVWVMLHSGSRNIGNKIGVYFINVAKAIMARYHINLPDKDLAYLAEGTQEFQDYIAAVEWAQRYARVNRELMMAAILRVTGLVPAEPIISCHHNYISHEHHFGCNVWVTRKGAVDASAGKLGIIPGSMGQKSYIVQGKGNPESFNSCSHGAGRAMSRSEAKRKFTVEDLKSQTEGVECRKDEGVIDEIPSAYKSLDKVMQAQADLVEIVHTLKAILTVKG